ncbi:MAG: response regulator [Thermoproteota archaeon]|nr:response regulator [Thermoproteota archaeon]
MQNRVEARRDVKPYLVQTRLYSPKNGMIPFVNVSNMHGGPFLSYNSNIANYYIKNNRGSIILKEDTNRGGGGGDDDDKPKPKLLIVDDEPEILQVLQIALEQNGFLVDAFTNPRGATKLQIQSRGFPLDAVRYQNACIIWNTTSKKSQRA